MTKFMLFASVMIFGTLSFGVINQSTNNQTMTHCEVTYTSNPFNNPSPTQAFTTCGNIYVGAHMGNDLLNPGKVTEMNTALHSGKPVTIKTTGVGFLAAYDITVEK